MAEWQKYAPKLKVSEGGYVNDPDDPGGCTKYGITLGVWKAHGHDKNGDGVIDCEDIKLLDDADFEATMKPHYWDRWRADEIRNQSLAEMLVDWTVNSGAHGVIVPQRVLGVTPDGIVGPATVAALNNADQTMIFQKIWDAHMQFYKEVVAAKPVRKNLWPDGPPG